LLKYFFPIFFNACLILIGGVFLYTALTEPTPVEVRVSKTAADTAKTFSNAAVLSAGKIYIPEPTPPMRYLAPRASFDVIYSVLFLLSAIVLVTFFWEFTYKRPFTIKTLWGLRILSWMLLIFAIIDYWRHTWFEEQVSQITVNQYFYEVPTPFAFPVFWIWAIMLRLVWIVKSGVDLQKDAELTV
jgi:hypothetical protein